MSLSQYERFVITSIVRQTVFKLGIINLGITARTEDPDAKPPMSQRFKAPIMDKLYVECTLQPLRECFDVMSATKLSGDIEEIRSALDMLCAELTTDGKLHLFADYLAKECQEAHDEFALIDNFQRKCMRLKDLNESQQQLRESSSADIEVLDERLYRLQAECEDRRMKMESNLIGEWERGRQEQTEAVFSHENRVLMRKLKEISFRTDRELIAINELRTFYDVKCEKLAESIAEWRKSFAEERNQLDQEIQKTEQSIANVQEQHGSIRRLFEDRDEFIESYRAEQLIRMIQRELEAKQCAAAVRLQAWWRATMVRKQLGPYRQRKKSKKPKKK